MTCSECRYFDSGCTHSAIVDLIGGFADSIPGDFPGCAYWALQICRMFPAVDALPRVDAVWGHDRQDLVNVNPVQLERLKCDGCGGTEFEVLRAAENVQAARCITCGGYFIIQAN